MHRRAVATRLRRSGLARDRGALGGRQPCSATAATAAADITSSGAGRSGPELERQRRLMQQEPEPAERRRRPPRRPRACSGVIDGSVQQVDDEHVGPEPGQEAGTIARRRPPGVAFTTRSARRSARLLERRRPRRRAPCPRSRWSRSSARSGVAHRDAQLGRARRAPAPARTPGRRRRRRRTSAPVPPDRTRRRAEEPFEPRCVRVVARESVAVARRSC